MDFLFENKYIRDKAWVKEISGYSLLYRPIMLAFNIIFAILFIAGVAIVIVENNVNLYLLVVPVYWFLFITILYFKNIKSTIKRNEEMNGGKVVEVTSHVTEDKIEQTHSSGLVNTFYYDNIKKVIKNKEYILIHSKANILYSFKRDGFTVGSEKEFLEFLMKKGFKVK